MKKNLTILLFSLAQISFSAEVHMAFGERLPPYIFPDTNTGIEIEIVRSALSYRGHTLKPDYFPMARIPVVFKTKQVDAVMMDVGENLEKNGGYYGDPPVIYRNVLFSLKKRKLVIKKPEDLKGLIVVGFVGAAKRYPEWFAQGVKDGTYSEKNDQSVQSELLRTGHAEVIVSDSDIFKYYALLMTKKNNSNEMLEVQEHTFTKENPDNYRPVFRDKKIRDDFNAGLLNVQKKKLDKIIYNKYLK